MSLPARGAWIEIIASAIALASNSSLPARGAWIEIDRKALERGQRLSLPARGAWIEIRSCPSVIVAKYVAPREGSVD